MGMLWAGVSGAVNGARRVADAGQAAGLAGFEGKRRLWKKRRGLAKDFWTD